MRSSLGTVLLALGLSAMVAQARAAQEEGGCASISDKDKRLACYDSSHEDAGGKDDKTSNTSEVLQAKSNDPPKKVDGDDLAIAPNKYVGKNVELSRAQCFYADKDEYRCLGKTEGVVLMVVAVAVSPAAEKERIESDCGQIKRLQTALCRRTLRFVPKKVEHDYVGISQRTVVTTPSIEMLPSASSGPRRR